MNQRDPLTVDEVEQALNFVSPDLPRNEWVKVGMALKSEFGAEGFDLFDSWSQGGASYDKANLKSTWRSSIKEGGGVTIGTLIKMATEGGWQRERKALPDDERKRLRAERDRRRKELAARIEADEKELAEWQERVAAASVEIQGLLKWGGKSEYLGRKKVGAYGVKFVPNGFVVVTHIGEKRIELITGKEAVSAFFDRQKAGEIDQDTISFKYIKFGTLAVPVRDEQGRLWGWQFIPPKGDKQFLKFGKKSGCFHMIAEHEGSYKKRPALADYLFSSSPTAITQCEGYSTGASIHQATGYPVVMAFDSGNMPHVARKLRAAFPAVPLIICGDNDRDSKENGGLIKARESAKAVKGASVVPDFSRYEDGEQESAA